MERATIQSNREFLEEKDTCCIWHPFSKLVSGRKPIPIVKAKGVYLYDSEGNAYIDAISSWWVNLHGHCHPYIAKRVAEQTKRLEQVIFADFTHVGAVELAGRLVQLLPGEMEKLFFSDNGSTSVEVAIKIALQYWYNLGIKDKSKILCFKGSYHGDTFGAMSCAGRNVFNRPFWSHLFEVEEIDPPIKGKEDVSIAQLEMKLRSGEIAAFIFEPLILGSGGMIMYSPEALDEMLEICKKLGVLTIADEVMTGFGRTGRLFACEYIRHSPDLICLAKGITGGFIPLGVTAIASHVVEPFLSSDPDKMFLHGHSFTANSIACSSALASLDLLQTTACLKQRMLIENKHKGFCSQWKEHPCLLRCESIGTILTLEYKTDSISHYFNTIRDRLYSFFLEQRIVLRPLGNVVYVLPPYCITEQELDCIYASIIHTFEEKI